MQVHSKIRCVALVISALLAVAVVCAFFSRSARIFLTGRALYIVCLDGVASGLCEIA